MSLYYRGIPGWKDVRHWVLRLCIMMGDVIAVSLSYSAAYFIRFHYVPFVDLFPATKGIPAFEIYLKAAPVILFMWVTAIYYIGAYGRLNYPALDESLRIFRASALGALLSMSAMFLYRENSYSRLVFGMGGVFSFASIYAVREIFKLAYLFWIRRNRKPHRVLVIGSGYLSGSLKKILEREGDRAVLKLSEKDESKIRRTITRSRIKEVLVAKSDFDHNSAIALAGFCEERGVKFRLLPDILELRMGEVLIDESLGVPTFQLKPVSLHGSAFLTKRIMDVTFATLFLGVFFIPLATIALIIKITSQGPIFYRQERLGYRKQTFNFLKFRTMVQNADELLEDLKAKSDRGGPVFKMKKDPRVTPFGKFLRRFSIDEMPQFLNVLKGEMSLVGPRPQVIWETKGYDEWAKKRLNVLPGITGLWQVSGRAELTFEEMIELDIYYIEHWSPGLDIKIMLKTLPAVLLGEGAY